MTRTSCFYFLQGLLLAATIATAAPGAAPFAWVDLPPLPPARGQTVQPGVAGAFAGVHGGALIVAGGANFPDKLPWAGGAKVWWDDIWVLEDFAGAHPRWVTERSFHLVRPLAYGVSMSTPDGVVCIGGSDATQCYAEVVLLSWDAASRSVRSRPLPALPTRLAFMTAAAVGNTVYVAGGQSTMKDATALPVFFALELRPRSDAGAAAWQQLPTWPGPPRILSVAVARREADGEVVYIFGGRAPEPGAATKIWRDAFRYSVAKRAWKTLPPVLEATGVSVMGATAAAVSGGELLIFGGDPGREFSALEQHDLAMADRRRALVTAVPDARARLESEIDEHTAAKLAIYHAHPGFSREILAYDVTRAAWRVAGTAPFPLPVTTTAVPLPDGIIFASGEIKPGIRTPRILRLKWTTP